MNSVISTLTVTSETDVRGQALLALIAKYLNVSSYYGFRPLGSNNVNFPCVMIDPISEKPVMDRLGQYHITWTYNVYFYVQESSPDAIVSQATYIGDYLVKLLSNNALSDLQTANPTNKFKQYPNPNGGYYWLNSEMSEIRWSTSFLNATPDNQQTYMRAGIMTFTIEDVVIK